MVEKLSILTDLVKLAKVDQEVREIEYGFLKVIAMRLMVPITDFDELFDRNIDFTPPKLEPNRILHFQRLVMMMCIDRQIAVEEIDFLKGIGIRMGLNPLATNRVLEEMNKYPNKVIPSERLIEIFQTYHN